MPGTPTTPIAGGSGAKQGAQAPKAKPVNVFSNDGSFLERFQRIQKVCVFALCSWDMGKVRRGFWRGRGSLVRTMLVRNVG